MAKRVVKKKSKKQLANTNSKQIAKQQEDVVEKSEKLCLRSISKKRAEFILDVSRGLWIDRLKSDDDDLFEKEMDRWNRIEKEFLRETTNPFELHLYVNNKNPDDGLHGYRKVAKHQYCDAGTALFLYWGLSPYYYLEYRLLRDAHEVQQETMKILRGLERRFRRDDFKTQKIPFDPAPFAAETRDIPPEPAYKIPEIMFEAVGPSPRKKR